MAGYGHIIKILKLNSVILSPLPNKRIFNAIIIHMKSLFQDFVPSSLITNEYAYWNPGHGTVSQLWEMTSGSLFLRNGRGYSGVPDTVDPNATSSNGTDSSVFRLTTKAVFQNHTTSFTLKPIKFSATTDTPAVDWDGIHIFLGYQDEFTLYYASVLRRDGKIVIKKKVSTKLLDAQKIKYNASDVSNGGVYYEITSEIKTPYQVPMNADTIVEASIQVSGTTVTISIFANGKPVLMAVDTGKVGGTAITTPGKTGIRGDNLEFEFANFIVNPL